MDGAPTVWEVLPRHSHLVGCHEVFQHWSLLAVGWGPVSVRKWQPQGALMSVNIPQYLCHWCPWRCSEPQPHLPRRRSETLRQAWPRLLWSHYLTLACSAFEICVPSKSGVLWSICAQALQSQRLWGLLLMPDPQVQEPQVRLRTLPPVGIPLWFNYLIIAHPVVTGLDYVGKAPPSIILLCFLFHLWV